MSSPRSSRTRAVLLAFGLLAGMAFVPASVAAAGSTIQVTTNLDQDLADGACSLREAILAANFNAAYHGCTAGSGSDTITFASGITEIVLEAAFAPVDEHLTIDGGFAVTINVAGQGGAQGPFRVEDGSLALVQLSVTGATGNVAYVNPTTSLTLVNAYIHNNSGDSAIYNAQGTVSISYSTFANNDAGNGSGAAVYNNGGTLNVLLSTFDSDHAASGGAIFNADGTATIRGANFNANPADNGGAIYSNGGSVAISSSYFTSNTASYGASIYLGGGSLTVADAELSTGAAEQGGGAIYVAGGSTATIRDTDIFSNTALFGGAIDNAGTLTVKGTTFDANMVAGSGHFGGALFSTGTATVTATTFTGNGADEGGAIYSTGTLSAGNLTIAGNSADTRGAGISASGPVTGSNLTITQNNAPASAGVYVGSASVVLKNSIIAGNSMGELGGQPLASGSTTNVTAVLNLDTYLDPAGPKPNGSHMKTIRIFRVSGSPFVDKGNSAACAAAPTSGKDERGVTRPTACDIGAMELEKGIPHVTSTPRPIIRTVDLVTLSGTSVRGGVSWKGADPGGSGIKRYIVARSLNGGSWSTLSSVVNPTYNQTVSPSSSYRFRVKAVDWDGNVSGWVYGPTFTSRLVQQSSRSVSYGKTWSSSSSASYSGGSAKYSKTAGASVSYTFTGRSVGFITTLGPARGRAKVYVNGVYQATVDLYAMVNVYRTQAWSKSWSTSGTRTIKVVVVGTSGRPRVDIDAFAVLK